jgi:proprotein convertase subtilisin/kexin type 2
MPIKWICLFGLLYAAAGVAQSSSAGNSVFTSSFLVRFKRSVGNDVAHELADKNGFLNVGPVSSNFLYFFD